MDETRRGAASPRRAPSDFARSPASGCARDRRHRRLVTALPAHMLITPQPANSMEARTTQRRRLTMVRCRILQPAAITVQLGRPLNLALHPGVHFAGAHPESTRARHQRDQATVDGKLAHGTEPRPRQRYFAVRMPQHASPTRPPQRREQLVTQSHGYPPVVPSYLCLRQVRGTQPKSTAIAVSHAFDTSLLHFSSSWARATCAGQFWR